MTDDRLNAIAAKAQNLAVHYKRTFELAEPWIALGSGQALLGYRFKRIVVIDWPDKNEYDHEWLERLTKEHRALGGTVVTL